MVGNGGLICPGVGATSVVPPEQGKRYCPYRFQADPFPYRTSVGAKKKWATGEERRKMSKMLPRSLFDLSEY